MKLITQKKKTKKNLYNSPFTPQQQNKQKHLKTQLIEEEKGNKEDTNVRGK